MLGFPALHSANKVDLTYSLYFFFTYNLIEQKCVILVPVYCVIGFLNGEGITTSLEPLGEDPALLRVLMRNAD